MRYGFRAKFQGKDDPHMKCSVEWSGFLDCDQAIANLKELLEAFEKSGGPEAPDCQRMKEINSTVFSQEIDE